jgi:murein DD-endopeptidase MepM/ murein hydrolase activator NlpD
MVDAYLFLDTLPIPESLQVYFRSLGAIFFQNYLLSGIVITIGLLLYSRIAFSLSLLGFFSAYFYYQIIGANIHELSYSFIGFNFILTAIAIGGFFLIPSVYSFLWTLLLIPLLSLLAISSHQVFQFLSLPILSLPFNIVVLLFLYGMKFRYNYLSKPQLVLSQQFSPEKNLYSWQNYHQRFGGAKGISLSLPFFGEWKVTQGHNGVYTHKDKWRHAWDFEIVDELNKPYKNNGIQPEDYYCFGMPVAAPGDATVEYVQDGVDENSIGAINTAQNWGNTIVLRHAPDLFTQLSHLKLNSIKVVKGQYVKKGEILAQCGNSGRSPIPHLHFQVQTTPYIGSNTFNFPLSNYLSHNPGLAVTFNEWTIPQENEIISNVTTNQALMKAFSFLAGQKLEFSVAENGLPKPNCAFDVKIDFYGYTYLECREYGAKAYFHQNNSLFYFTHYEGSKKSMLFLFYLAAYKIILCYHKKLIINDRYSVPTISGGLIAGLHDFVSPFTQFIRGSYRLSYLRHHDLLNDSEILLQGKAAKHIFGRTTTIGRFSFKISGKGIEEFRFHDNNRQISLREIV